MITVNPPFVGELGIAARNNPLSSTGGLVRAFSRQTGQIVLVRRILTADGLAALTAGCPSVAGPYPLPPPNASPGFLQYWI